MLSGTLLNANGNGIHSIIDCWFAEWIYGLLASKIKVKQS